MAKSDHDPQPQKVLIVDDHPIMRQGLRLLIGKEADLAVCGEAEDVYGALGAIERTAPDVAIVDISLKESSGLDLIKEIKNRWPKLPVIVLSMHAQSLYTERAFRAGASGYVTKDEASISIVEALRQVLAGGAYVSKSLASEMILKMVSGRSDSAFSPLDNLSDREFQVFGMIGQGLRTSEIAAKLHISTKTVDAHREHIKRKLNLDSAADLLKYAIQWQQLDE